MLHSVANLSLEEVISRCRDRIVSKFVIHHKSHDGKGKMISLNWDSGSPPTFHEQRSLSERLYREQGMDTQRLLGHKKQTQTDK